mgnify:CR=1 FL=1
MSIVRTLLIGSALCTLAAAAALMLDGGWTAG